MILHRWRAGQFLTTIQKPIDITKHQQNALQFIDIDRKLREVSVNGLNIITADISKGDKQLLKDQMRSANDRRL